MSRFDSDIDQPKALVNRQGVDSPEDSSKRSRMTAGFRESADGQKEVRPARLRVVAQRAAARDFPTRYLEPFALQQPPASDPDPAFVPAGSLLDYRRFRKPVRRSFHDEDAMRTRSAGTARRWPVSPQQETAISRAQPLKTPQALRA